VKIAFIACNRNAKLFRTDPSYIYRCENLGLELTRQGHQVSFCHITDSLFLNKFDFVVFHRPRNLWRIHFLVVSLRLRGAKVWADFDDLIFDISLAEFSPGVVNQINTLEKTIKTYQSHASTLSLFDGFTVSTKPLKAHLLNLQINKPIKVLPNAPHFSWEHNLAAFRTTKLDFSAPVLTYLPGTRSHDKDFKLIADQLTIFLRSNKKVSLEITGPLSFQLAEDVARQVRHYEKLTFSKFHERFQSTWINLAPLEDTPFNQCKSALKVLEAGFWGKPTVCSVIPDVLRYTKAGALCLETPEDLCTKLNLLLKPDDYLEHAQNLQSEVLKVSNIAQVTASFLELIESNEFSNGLI